MLELRFGLDSHGSSAKEVADVADRVEVLPDRLLLYVDDGDQALAAVHARGLVPESALVRRSTLEDVFLRPHRAHAGGLRGRGRMATDTLTERGRG